MRPAWQCLSSLAVLLISSAPRHTPHSPPRCRQLRITPAMACPSAGNELNIGRIASRRRPRSGSTTNAETTRNLAHGLAGGGPRQRTGPAQRSSSASPAQSPSPTPTLDQESGESDQEDQTAAETQLPSATPSPDGLTPDGARTFTPCSAQDDTADKQPLSPRPLNPRCPVHASLPPPQPATTSAPVGYHFAQQQPWSPPLLLRPSSRL